MSILKIKIKGLPSRDANASTPLIIRLSSQVAKPYRVVYVLICFCFFETLKECIPDLFDVPCYNKI